MTAILEERRRFRRCTRCGAYDGQRVWRLKADPRLYWPGPVEGGETPFPQATQERDRHHPHPKARDAGARKFVTESGLYEPDLETVHVGLDSGLCGRCCLAAGRPAASS